MGVRETFVTVHQAAEILGVVANTVRTWGVNGKIPEYRHPINGYRLDKRGNLEQLVKRMEKSDIPSHPRRRNRGA